MQSLALLLVPLLAVCYSDAAHLDLEDDVDEPRKTTVQPLPIRPYAFAYTAGRYPGHADRHHAEVGDGSGVVRGTFSYLDPRQKLRKVDYVADKQGFHPILNEPHPPDTFAVAKAKERHQQLFDAIAASHANYPVASPEQSLPKQSEAVARATEKHASLFKVIAEQHARIAAEREELQQQQEDEEGGPLQELEL